MKGSIDRALGAVAAVVTWLGWIAICPALGFPVLGAAATVNRVFFRSIPEAGHQPDFWLGWVMMIGGLAGAAVAFFTFERVRTARAGILAGLLYGAGLWLLAGLVIMPLIGFLAPPQADPVLGQPPDSVKATLMMYQLGPAPALASLIAWLLFGAILGATTSARTPSHALAVATVASLSFGIVLQIAVPVDAQNAAASQVTVKTLAQGPVKSLPPGKIYISVLEFRQRPGGDFGPHYHFPGFIYALRGVATMPFRGAATRTLAPGEATFIPFGVEHTHKNLSGQVAAGVVAVGLIVVAVLLCAVTWLGVRSRLVVALLLGLLIAGGAYPLTGGASNDWYFITVRPEKDFRFVAMPRPDGHVVYASPNLDPVPSGPYVEILSAITLPPGARYDAPAAFGSQTIIVSVGTARVEIGGVTAQLGVGESALAQSGQTLVLVNHGSGALKVLDFAVTSLSPSS